MATAAAAGSIGEVDPTARASSCVEICSVNPSLVRSARSAARAPTLPGFEPGTASVVAVVSAGVGSSYAHVTFVQRLADGAHANVYVVVSGDDAESIERFIGGLLSTPGRLRVVRDHDASMTRRFGTTLFPETFFIDPGGRTRVRVDGTLEDIAPSLRLIEQLASGGDCDVDLDRKPGAGGPDLRVTGRDEPTCRAALR